MSTSARSACARRAFFGCLGSWLGRVLLLCLAAILLALPAPGQAWNADQMAQAARRLGPGAVAALPSLQAMLSSTQKQDELTRLITVNRFYNLNVLFRTDMEIWNQEDYWASPLEALNMGRGDCEDFAIAKYATLLAAGVPMERMRLVYVRARLPDQASLVPHMVLAYYARPDAEPLILDNLNPEVVPAGQRPDLMPVFSFNSAGLWQGVGAHRAGDPMARLSRWRDVWQRTLLEGFQ